MGRWTQYDEDDYRLPEGMKRVGYDTDTQRYTFKDRSGGLWIGPSGSEFGEMTKATAQVSDGSHIREREADGDNDDLEASGPARADGYQPLSVDGSPLHHNRSSYRTLLPFLLIIMVVLLLVVRIFGPSALAATRPPPCPENSRPYEVKAGDSCWEISKEHGTSLEDLQGMNPKVDCAVLRPGQQVCIPLASSAVLMI